MISAREFKIILIIWLAVVGLYGVSRYYQLKWNDSASMPQKLWFVAVGNKDLKVDDYVVFRFHDSRMSDANDFEYVVKQVGGVAGDKILVRDWNGYEQGVPYPNKTSLIYILPGGFYPTFDILSGNHFTPLTTESMTIPTGYYFVHGQHEPSFDSRYKEFGLVCNKQIFGKSFPIF